MAGEVDVLGTDEFEAWFLDLPDDDAKAVDRYVELLAARGVALGHPYSSAIKGSKHAIRELRVRHAGKAIRVFYAFDPKRRAIVLLGGDKKGNDRFYDEYVPRADRVFDEYLARSKAGEEV